MKKLLIKMLTNLGLLTAIAAVTAVGSAQGQSLTPKLRVNIPFDFILADKKLPAGDYLIGRAQQFNGDMVLSVSSVNGHSNTFRLTSPVVTLDPKDKGTVVFHRYGDEYFLSQVWAPGANTGRMFSESRGEREAKARIASDKMTIKAGTVTVVDGPW